SPLAGERLGEHEAGLGAGRAPGGEGEPLGQRVVEAAQRLAAERQQLLGVARRAGLEAPGGDPQPVDRVEVADRLDEVPQDRPAAGAGQVGGDDLAVERVRHLHDRAVADDLDEPPALQLLDVVGVGEPLGRRQRHLLADGDDLERGPGAGVEQPQALLDELAQPGGGALRRARGPGGAPRPPLHGRGHPRGRARARWPSGRRTGPAAPLARRCTAAVTSARTNSALPRLSSQLRSSSDAGTPSPTTWSTSSAVAARSSGPMSSRVSSSSFQSATSPGGSGSPVRTLTSSRAEDCVATRCSRATEVSSSRWASSTASRNGPVPARASRRARARCRRSSWLWAAASGARRCANEPSWIWRAASVARTHSTAIPSRRQPSTASAMSRVLPTPGSPKTATPRGPPVEASVRRTVASSASRPTSGQRANTNGSYRPGRPGIT